MVMIPKPGRDFALTKNYRHQEKRGFSWIFIDFLYFLDFLDFNSVIQTEGFGAGLSADLDFNPAKVSFTGLRSTSAT